MPLLQDQELAQFFTGKTKEWKDKEKRPLRAPRMPPTHITLMMQEKTAATMDEVLA
jgi:hypothetical protein